MPSDAAPSRASDPVLERELGEALRDLEAAEPAVASTPPGIDSGPGTAPGEGASWRLWEIFTPSAGSH